MPTYKYVCHVTNTRIERCNRALDRLPGCGGCWLVVTHQRTVYTPHVSLSKKDVQSTATADSRETARLQFTTVAIYVWRSVWRNVWRSTACGCLLGDPCCTVVGRVRWIHLSLGLIANCCTMLCTTSRYIHKYRHLFRFSAFAPSTEVAEGRFEGLAILSRVRPSLEPYRIVLSCPVRLYAAA